MATTKNKIKTYVDTSVFGGVFDKEFKKVQLFLNK